MIHLIGYLGKKRNGRIFEETLAIISTCPVDKERDGGSGIFLTSVAPPTSISVTATNVPVVFGDYQAQTFTPICIIS